MLNETTLGKKKKSQSKVSHQDRERRDLKICPKPICTKVVTIWGLISASFHTLELFSRNIKASSFSFIPCLTSLLLIMRHFFVVSLCDFRTHNIRDVLSNMALSYPMASQGDEPSNVPYNLIFTTLPGVLCSGRTDLVFPLMWRGNHMKKCI